MLSVFQDTAKTVPGKSTGKGVTVLIQGASVVALMQLALNYFEVPNQELWVSVGTPVLTAGWHILQKFILHKLGLRVEFKPPMAKILP